REDLDRNRRNRRLRSAADHHIVVAALDYLEAVADGVRARRARGRRRGVRPLRAEAYGDLSGGEVDDGRRDEEGRDATGAVVEELFVLALDGPEVADAAADVCAGSLRDFVAVRLRNLLPALDEAAVVDGLVRRRDGVLDERAHLAGFLFLDELERVEALDLGGDLHGELRGVELLDVAHAAAARHQCSPRVGDRVADGRDESA